MNGRPKKSRASARLDRLTLSSEAGVEHQLAACMSPPAFAQCAFGLGQGQHLHLDCQLAGLEQCSDVLELLAIGSRGEMLAGCAG